MEGNRRSHAGGHAREQETYTFKMVEGSQDSQTGGNVSDVIKGKAHSVHPWGNSVLEGRERTVETVER